MHPSASAKRSWKQRSLEGSTDTGAENEFRARNFGMFVKHCPFHAT
jgi:hypothetical protein